MAVSRLDRSRMPADAAAVLGSCRLGARPRRRPARAPGRKLLGRPGHVDFGAARSRRLLLQLLVLGALDEQPLGGRARLLLGHLLLSGLALGGRSGLALG